MRQGIYFIRGIIDYQPCIKIGISNDPARRMSELMNEGRIKNPALKLLAFWEPKEQKNMRVYEKTLHLSLGNWHVYRWGTEWFDYRAALHVMWWVKLFQPDVKIYDLSIPSPLTNQQKNDMWGMFLDTFVDPNDPRAIALMNALDL